jgi:Tol biopolymer transport system component
MRDVPSTSVRLVATSLCLVICSALVLSTKTGTQDVFAGNVLAFNQRAQSTWPTSAGKVNGKIVFTSERNKSEGGLKLWTMNPDGSNPTPLTNESGRDPSLPSYMPVYDGPAKWSPDGSKIAFRAIRNGDFSTESFAIYLMNPDGGNAQRIVIDSSSITEAVEMGGFEWSPDGTRFVFDAGAYATIDSFGKLTANLFTSSLDGKSVTRLTNDHEVMNGAATWSPDGKMIAFVSNSQNGGGIQVMNADGSNRRAIAVGSSPAWSPDGSKILFVGPSEYGTCQSYVCQQLYLMNLDGSGVTQLTNYAASYISPKYSPDGTKIIFERDLTTSYNWDNRQAIFVMDADGNNQINISNRHIGATDSDYQPDWQPLSTSPNGPAPSVLGFSEVLYVVACEDTEITVTRSGNLDQNVSCDYQSELTTLRYRPPVTLNFAPGETSKTIRISGTCDVTYPTRVCLSNNAANATFLGGAKEAMVSFVPKNSNPIDSSPFFVRQHYRDFLGREPDFAGWDFWTGVMGYYCSGDPTRDFCITKRSDTSASFFLSIEFQESGYLAYRTYKAAYGNLPSLPVPIKFNEFLPDMNEISGGVIVGQRDWQQRLETNKQSFMSEFVQRPRFVTAYPPGLMPSQFVDALFANAGITPAVAERQSLMAEFPSGINTADNAARARVLRRVAENPTLAQRDFNRAFVLMEYFGYLRRNPNDAPDSDFSGYDFWLNKLNQFNGDFQKAEMVKAFITSTEYRKRFGP